MSTSNKKLTTVKEKETQILWFKTLPVLLILYSIFLQMKPFVSSWLLLMLLVILFVLLALLVITRAEGAES